MWKNVKLYNISIIVGFVSGLICVAYRHSIHLVTDFRNKWIAPDGQSDAFQITHHISDNFIHLVIKYAIFFTFIVFILFIVEKLIRRFPTSSGSGLPQTKALIEGKMVYYKPFLSLITKFFGGISSIASGLSFGREGPSIQIGSLIGHMFGKELKFKKEDTYYLIAAGAGAGVAAAFSAPLASAILIIESLKSKSLPDSKKIIITCLLSGVAAGIVTTYFFPNNIYDSISIHTPSLNQSSMILIYIIMGICFTLMGKLMSIALIKWKNISGKWKIKPIKKVLLSASIICCIAFFFPLLIGGNQGYLVDNLNSNNYSIIYTSIVLIVLTSFTIFSNSTGLPGGLFIPLLTIGGLAGKLFCLILIKMHFMDFDNIGFFAMIGMSIMFIVVVRTPLTGFVLIGEMTGRYDVAIPTLIVGVFAYFFSELIRLKSLNDVLYNYLLQTDFSETNDGKIINNESKSHTKT